VKPPFRMSLDRPLLIATRGSPLALAQADLVATTCRAAFPALEVRLRIIKTTGDKLQKASLAKPGDTLPKGLFTKELEVALLEGQADLAVHSLKDLPTDLPAGLELGAVLERADARDVLVYRSEEPGTSPVPRRGFAPHLQIAGLPAGAVIATSSTRRREQMLALRPDLRVVEIRGNVGTRLQKLADQAAFDATLLAAAGLARLGFRIETDGRLVGPADAPGRLPVKTRVPDGVLAVLLPVEEMIPCVGQAAIGLEVRAGDTRLAAVCARLNHEPTFQCVSAERAFLRALGGGCQSPVAAFATATPDRLVLRGVSFRSGPARRAEVAGPPGDAARLGEELAAELR